MFYKEQIAEDKYDELCDLSDDELLDRICAFPNQTLLNTDRNGFPRKLQVGLVAEQYRQKPLNDTMQQNLTNAFASITTLAAKTQDRPNMPDNAYGVDMWNFDQGDVNGQKIDFGLQEEPSGKIAVYVPTTDLTTVKIGYLDQQFADTYPVNGSRIVTGQYYKGQVEIILDAEELYSEAELEPVLTNDGKHMYEMSFAVSNIQYETQKWGNHDENPQILQVFCDNMNAFPVKEMIGSILEQNGLDNSITDITWDVINDEQFRMHMISDKPLDGSQLLCADKALSYLMVDSAYDENKDNHVFGKYMDADDEFLKAIQNTFETEMYPECSDLIDLKGPLAEVKAESDMDLLNDFSDAVANIPVNNENLEQ